jgi:hypothetical protein
LIFRFHFSWYFHFHIFFATLSALLAITLAFIVITHRQPGWYTPAAFAH